MSKSYVTYKSIFENVIGIKYDNGAKESINFFKNKGYSKNEIQDAIYQALTVINDYKPDCCGLNQLRNEIKRSLIFKQNKPPKDNHPLIINTDNGRSYEWISGRYKWRRDIENAYAFGEL